MFNRTYQEVWNVSQLAGLWSCCWQLSSAPGRPRPDSGVSELQTASYTWSRWWCRQRAWTGSPLGSLSWHSDLENIKFITLAWWYIFPLRPVTVDLTAVAGATCWHIVQSALSHFTNPGVPSVTWNIIQRFIFHNISSNINLLVVQFISQLF